MKLLTRIRNSQIDGDSFTVYKAYEWYAQKVLYILNMQAKKNFFEKYGIEPDFAIISDCIVNHD